jgi:hypothetical protein
MKREKSKIKINNPFAFEEFLKVNKVDIAELSDSMQTMISTIRSQREVAKEKCTVAHYKIVKQRLQPFADIVDDYLLNHYDESLQNNVLDEDGDSISKKGKGSEKELQVEAILALTEKFDRNYLLSSELKSLGIKVDYSKKEILIDALRLERELTTAKWYLGTNPNYKEVQS